MTLETAPAATVQAVEHITQQGDSLDNLRFVYRRLPIGATAALGAGFVGAYEGTYGIIHVPQSHFALAGAATSVAYIAGRARDRRDRNRFDGEHMNQAAIQDEYGIPVEVFRDRKTKELDVRWYSPYERDLTAEELLQEMTALKRLAADAEIDRITVTVEPLDEYIDDTLAQRAVTQNQWFKKTKRRAIKDRAAGNDDVLTLSPAELNQLTARLESAHSIEPLDTIMRILGRVAPQHLAARYYAPGKMNQTHKEKIECIFRQKIEQRTEAFGVHIPEDDLTETQGYVTRQKIHFRGSPKVTRGGQVVAEFRSSQDYSQREYKDLIKELGIDRHGLAEVLKNWENYPAEKIVRLCELTGWLTLNGQTIELDSAAIAPKQANGFDGQNNPATRILLQERIRDRVVAKGRHNKQRRNYSDVDLGWYGTRRFLKRVLAVSAFAIAGIGLMEQAESQWAGIAEGFNFEEQAEQDKAVRKHPPAFIYENFSEIMGHYIDGVANVTDKAFIAAGISRAPDERLENLPRDSRDTLGGQDDQDPSTSEVGNVSANSKNKPLWTVKSLGGMSSEGLWYETVHDRTYVSPAIFGYRANLEWATADDTADPHNAAALPDPESLDQSQPMLSVSRVILAKNNENIGVSDTYFERSYGSSSTPGMEGYAVLHVPVLDGTKIIAAKINNKLPVSVHTTQYGLQQLVLKGQASIEASKSKGIVIEYVLAPDSGTGATANGPITFPKQHPLDQRAIDQAWQERTGTTLPTDPREKLKFEKEYVSGKFEYNLAPFDSRHPIPSDPTEYVGLNLRIGRAVCNSANTLLALSNSTEVNYATGFSNSNTAEQKATQTGYLSSHEAHSWTVDHEGEEHDATPPDSTGKYDEFFVEDYKDVGKDPRDDRWRNTKLLVEAGLGAAALAIALRKRKKIAGVARNTIRKTASRRLQATPSETIARAENAVKHVIWAPPSSAYNSPIGGSNRTGSLSALHDYAANDETQKTVRAQLKQAAATSSDEHLQRDLRHARRVLRLINTSKLDLSR